MAKSTAGVFAYACRQKMVQLITRVLSEVKSLARFKFPSCCMFFMFVNCICVCMCVCACVLVCAHVCIQAQMYIYIYKCIYICAHTHACTHACTNANTH